MLYRALLNEETINGILSFTNMQDMLIEAETITQAVSKIIDYTNNLYDFPKDDYSINYEEGEIRIKHGTDLIIKLSWPVQCSKDLWMEEQYQKALI